MPQINVDLLRLLTSPQTCGFDLARDALDLIAAEDSYIEGHKPLVN
jgi:hypothetical protein